MTTHAKQYGSGLTSDAPIRHTHDLARFLGGSGDSFTGQLIDLIAKADPGNRVLLREAFPRQVEAWEAWMECGQALHFDRAPTAAELADYIDYRLHGSWIVRKLVGDIFAAGSDVARAVLLELAQWSIEQLAGQLYATPSPIERAAAEAAGVDLAGPPDDAPASDVLGLFQRAGYVADAPPPPPDRLPKRQPAAQPAASGPGWAPPFDHHDEGTSYCANLPEHGDELHPYAGPPDEAPGPGDMITRDPSNPVAQRAAELAAQMAAEMAAALGAHANVVLLESKPADPELEAEMAAARRAGGVLFSEAVGDAQDAQAPPAAAVVDELAEG